MSLEKENKPNIKTKRQMRSGGLFSTKEKKVIPGPRYATSGNVTMSTDGATYRFPNPYGATQVMFFGIASRTTSGDVDIRADVFGVAQLRPSYYFEPQTDTSVAVAAAVQKVIQAGKWFLIVDESESASTPEYRARAIETTLVNIDWPNSSTIVARAEIVNYGPDWFEVEVSLASGWQIVGNFMCT